MNMSPFGLLFTMLTHFCLSIDPPSRNALLLPSLTKPFPLQTARESLA